ncbi:polyamine aminopropyltransferase [Candidatus Calescamantes bacterium]|nr:polyamine aminopropyltransferase [Candidatus Calescamantes bacterium]
MDNNSLGELWLCEAYHQWGNCFKIKQILHSEQSLYQRIEVILNEKLGKILVLDGSVMFSEKDEFIYHEMIVHVPLCTHPEPKDILVVGGGDGGAVREILKHQEVANIKVVELDSRVIEVCKKFFPNMGKVWESPKVKVENIDGLEFIQKCSKNQFDIIIVDGIDPIGYGAHLFEEEFYYHANRLLKEKGIFVQQTESPFYHFEWVCKIFGKIKKFFHFIAIYTIPMPTYPSGWWCFTIASNSLSNITIPIEAKGKHISKMCKYYNLDVHKSSFKLPNFLLEKLK